MSDTIEPRLTDKRTIDRYLRIGLVDEKTWERHLKGLADATEKAAPIEATMSTSIDDEDEDNDVEA
ncbi:MAG: hypothetical protein K1X64_22745 [Myxococcaceae bacterium]|nr:hypothetical protein [Myxococcaceae bacterium]